MTTQVNDPYTLHTLDNGLRVVIERMPDVRSAAAGFLIRTGARDEEPIQAGVSHFLEHMMFKGTARRNWQEITIDFDRMGSTYNAYTSEDRTMFYGWVRTADVGKQIELLADMMRSSLPANEFEMEKKVVLEEIAMAKDSLEHVAFDFLQEKVFAGHPLAWPILGYQRTLEPLSRDQMMEYFEQRYAPDNMLLVIAGNVDPQQTIDFAERYCGSWKPSGSARPREVPRFHSGTDVLTVERFAQQIVALTYPSVAAGDELAETATAAAMILGGDNSRFFWDIVQAGLSPRAGVHHVEYTDCGMMVLFAACQPENADKVVEVMRSEAKRICSERVKQHEVDRVKNMRRINLAIEAEAPYHRLTQLMDDMEARGYPRTVDQMLAEVDAITPDRVFEYLQQYPINSEGHLASVGPRHWPEE